MLAVTAGDGACGENSTQPTARVSQVVFGVPDTGAGAHHLHVPGFGSAFISAPEDVLAKSSLISIVDDDRHLLESMRRLMRSLVYTRPDLPVCSGFPRITSSRQACREFISRCCPRAG
jgi:hypothetical protein